MPEFRRHISTIKRKCKYCSFTANLKGIASHERACKKQQEDAAKSVAFSAIRRGELEGAFTHQIHLYIALMQGLWYTAARTLEILEKADKIIERSKKNGEFRFTNVKFC